MLFLFSFYTISCGIEEYYYLPQVPESNINPTLNTEASITIPTIDRSEFYYFRNYSIFYRIYISDQEIIFDSINTYPSELRSDFNAIRPYTDPTNISASTSVDQMLRNRNYYELSFEGKSIDSMLLEGKTLQIIFPTDNQRPYAYIDEVNPTNIIRSTNGSENDRYFYYSESLVTDPKNTDVARRSGERAYVSMYIVATGYDSINFRTIFSKPTHINIFILTNR